MNDFSQFKPAVRYTNSIMIYFKDKHTIVASQGPNCIIFHRWFERKLGDYYNKWYPFCHALKRRNTLKTLRDICELAVKFDIDHQTVTTTINSIPPRGIKEIPSYHVW